VVAEMAAADADETSLLRAAHNLKPEDQLPEQAAAATAAARASVEAAVDEASTSLVGQA
jgi:hypothetical protein